ncbi:MAG: HAD family hydrolase [Thiomonas sp.]|jgi:phosphoglycolate phosphatase
MMRPRRIQACLFDLDGTLADTAPDLAAALNHVRAEHGLHALPLEVLRPMASHGARGLLAVGMQVQPDDPRYPALKDAFLARYLAAIRVHTTLFDGVETLIDRLHAAAIPWGIVTNKLSTYTDPLVAQLPWPHPPGCIVSGDSAPRAKPAPDPLLLAARQLDVAPQNCLYLGDDLRDIQAARAAGMHAIAAAYGYCGPTTPASWGADAIISHPLELLALDLMS